ncbi:hypothetical protein ACPL_6030 [Actinoplanes sp. SE50/110]|nr:hypothetical protein ACPL_6030 [Actinoplanes sp. SE50/110]SLM02724.1 hypothetical protein ACSP50_6009 [Actinoplanes sp. SE50/110]
MAIRMPTAEKRTAHDITDGVPVSWVIQPDGSAAAYPSERWQTRS